MPSRTYNTFYKGIQQDDFLTNGANFIEGKNVTGLTTGYGLTLGPKPTKNVFTTQQIRACYDRFVSATGSQEVFGVGGDLAANTGVLYDLISPTDNTPDKTFSGADTAWANMVNGAYFGGEYYLVGQRDVGPFKDYNVHYATGGSPISGTYAYDRISANQNSTVPPILTTSSFIYFGFLGTVERFDSSNVKTTFGIFGSGSVVGMTQHGTTILVYTDAGIVSYWDGVSASVLANNQLGFIPKKVTQIGNVDYITAEDGEMYVGSGYQVQRIIEKIQSGRLEDNSTYITKFNFDTNNDYAKAIESIKGGIVAIADDTTPGIYQFDNLIEGLPKGFHKILSTNSQDLGLNNIYDVLYVAQENKLYYAYDDGTNKGVDTIDFTSLETAKTGYAVTDVFTGGTTFSKQIDKVRITTSNTNGTNNFIKLYMRRDNGSWELLRTINDSTATIDRKSITEATGDFIDIQFKVEYSNDLQDNTPPILHELYLEYTINKNNG